MGPTVAHRRDRPHLPALLVCHLGLSLSAMLPGNPHTLKALRVVFLTHPNGEILILSQTTPKEVTFLLLEMLEGENLMKTLQHGFMKSGDSTTQHVINM